MFITCPFVDNGRSEVDDNIHKEDTIYNVIDHFEECRLGKLYIKKNNITGGLYAITNGIEIELKMASRIMKISQMSLFLEELRMMHLEVVFFS